MANWSCDDDAAIGLGDTVMGRRSLRWQNAYFVLRGSRDLRDLICVNPHTDGSFASWWGSRANMIINGKFWLSPPLTVITVPRGSQWTLSISDAPTREQSPPTCPSPIGVQRSSGARFRGN
jgi:hypothetical protein